MGIFSLSVYITRESQVCVGRETENKRKRKPWTSKAIANCDKLEK